MRFGLLLVAILVATVRSTSAELVTNTFIGQITKLRVGPDSLGHPAVNSDGPALGGTFAGLRAGDSMSFSFVYDSVGAPTWSDPSGMAEYAVVAWSIAAGFGRISDTGEYDRILVYNDCDFMGDGARDLFALSIQDGYWASVDFQDRGLDALSSTAIPNNTFNLGSWDQQIYGFDADGWFVVKS